MSYATQAVYKAMAVTLAFYFTLALAVFTAIALVSSDFLLTPRDAAELWIAYAILAVVFWQRWTISGWLRAPLTWLVSLTGWRSWDGIIEDGRDDGRFDDDEMVPADDMEHDMEYGDR